MTQTTKPKQIWTIILAVITLILTASAVSADVTLDGIVWDQDGNLLDNVNVSVYNSGSLNVSDITDGTGAYSMTIVTSVNNIYNITFTKTGYNSSIVISKVMLDANSYTVNRTLVQTNNDFDGDGLIDTHDCFKNDATRGTSGGVYDNRYDTNCNGIYQGDEVAAPSSGGSSSSSSSRRRGGGGILFSVREYNLTTLGTVRVIATYADVLRIAYEGEEYDLTLARVRNDSVRFKMGDPIDSYFTLTEEDPVREIYTNQEYDIPGMYITYYGNLTEDARQIGFEISSEPFNQTDVFDNVTDNMTGNQTDNETIPLPPVNITPNVTDNETGNATSNQTVFGGRVGSTIRSFAQGEATLGETAAQLFSMPVVKVPILILLGGMVGLGLIVGTRQFTRSMQANKKAKAQEITEEDITPDTITRISDVLQKQLDIKNMKRLKIQKQKY